MYCARDFKISNDMSINFLFSNKKPMRLQHVCLYLIYSLRKLRRINIFINEKHDSRTLTFAEGMLDGR